MLSLTGGPCRDGLLFVLGLFAIPSSSMFVQCISRLLKRWFLHKQLGLHNWGTPGLFDYLGYLGVLLACY